MSGGASLSLDGSSLSHRSDLEDENISKKCLTKKAGSDKIDLREEEEFLH
jgi:hypothetical protein